MPFQKGHPGGPGRPPKPVEDARKSVLLELFNEQAERDVVNAQIRVAKKGDTSAATWLWDRKYGKVKDVIDQEMIVRVVRERYDRGHSTADPSPAAGSDQD